MLLNSLKSNGMISMSFHGPHLTGLQVKLWEGMTPATQLALPMVLEHIRAAKLCVYLFQFWFFFMVISVQVIGVWIEFHFVNYMVEFGFKTYKISMKLLCWVYPTKF